MKPCPFCGEQIQPAAVKCRFCGEWLDPSKRPAWSGQDLAVLTEQITREVTRQLAPQAADARPSSPPTTPSARPPRRRSSTRDIPSDPSMAGVVSPDDSGRAAGSVEFDPRPAMEPSEPPAYESPGPYPGLEHGDHGRTLGQPAPRGARWQPGAEDSGPKSAPVPAWQPPLSEESSQPEFEPQATGSDSVWQAPSWLRPEERPAQQPASAAPSWAPTSYEQPAATPSWNAPAAAPATTTPPAWAPPSSQLVETPVWQPEPEPTPRARARRIPELGLDPEPRATTGVPADDDEHFVDGGFADEFDDDEFDDGDDDFEDAPAKPVRRSRKADRQAIVDAQLGAQTAALEPEPVVAAIAAPVAEKTKPAKPSKPKRDDDDDFDDDDDDDDDFDDDDDDFDDDDASGTSLTAESVAATAQPRKLPWVPIAAVAGALVLISSYVFRDALFGSGDDTQEADESGEVAGTEPETPPAPEPKPEPKPEAEQPKPEPPPPAIPDEELEKLLADATNLVNRQKHNDAAKIIDEILEKIPNQPRALALRALTLMEKQKYDESLETANACVEADDTQADCWIVIASVEQLKGENLARALEGYNKYLEFAPKGRYAKSAKLEAQRLKPKVEG